MAAAASLRSRSAALGGALLWAFGTVLFPTLHLAQHARPHDHEGGGIRYHLDETSESAHDDHEDDDEPGGPLTVEAPHGHGHRHHDGGLAHFAVATGENAGSAVEFSVSNAANRAPDLFASRHGDFFLEGKKAARAPPAA